jgi:hypothetical protein
MERGCGSDVSTPWKRPALHAMLSTPHHLEHGATAEANLGY